MGFRRVPSAKNTRLIQGDLMKKLVIASLCAVAFSANALEVGLSVGRDRNVDDTLYVLSAGTSVAGLKVSAEAGGVLDKYATIGASVGREFKVWRVGVTPHAGLGYISTDVAGKESGGVGNTGVEVSVPLFKGVSAVVDYTYNWDIQSKTDFRGGIFTAGVRMSF
jgi:hypothetical protein